MKNKLSSQNLGDNTPSLSLHSVSHPAFYQTLQFLRCFEKCPGTPIFAAYLSIIFYDLGLQNSLEKLHSWLEPYVSSFASKAPRDQADLSDKTLAVAVYLFLCDFAKLTPGIPVAHLIDYIEYASKQDWFNNTNLAYYCHLLRDNVRACENVHKYFVEHFSLFVERKHVPSIAQSLIVLDGSEEAVDRHSGYTIILNTLAEMHCPINHMAWGLAALSSSSYMLGSLEEIEGSWSKLEQSLNDYMTRLLQESKIPILLAMVWSGMEADELSDGLNEWVTVEATTEIFDEPENYRNHRKVCIQLPAAEIAFDSLSLVDLAVALFAMYKGRRHKVIGVSAFRESDLQNAITNQRTLKKGNGVVISWFENFVTLLLTLSFTLVLGVAISLFFLGAKFQLPFVLPDPIPRDYDVFGVILVCVACIAIQVLSFLSNKSPISVGLEQLPILSDIYSFLAARLQKRTEEGTQEK